MNPLEILKSKKLVLEEYNLMEQIGHEYWHSNILDQNRNSFASGFGYSNSVSRKIAFSEYLERSSFISIRDGGEEKRTKWGFEINSMGCGFAAGFNLKNTIIRSLGEACERWVLSKWIDDGYFLKEIEHKMTLEPVSQWFYNQFEKVLLFEKNVLVQFAENFYEFKIGVTAGLKNDGIFLGSSAQLIEGSVWQHALLESFRHLLAANNSVLNDSFPSNRIKFFAKNQSDGLGQIRRAKKMEWPIPSVKFHNHETVGEYCIARTILDGWVQWNIGSENRFLY